jgi:hypothetical protein
MHTVHSLFSDNRSRAPDDSGGRAELKKRVASLINMDKDAKFYIEAHGPIERRNTSAGTSMSHMFQRGIQAKSQVHA